MTEAPPTPITADRRHAAVQVLGRLRPETPEEFRRGMAALGFPVNPTELALLLAEDDLVLSALAERWTALASAPTPTPAQKE
ncbi:hypothetical protein [Allobranchiibius sp. GilTou73]|uniref:hypothetical protein n=1 Tax=Allobranchiibius sp. GilTou73 TaxID=2904523 RepID=UPI001F3C1427|nr:hypothetical protein [Allobranchiibius sp. GilTou73]UIJ33370.1 hypothetical protein LVQ62_09215 [Allobranchiibius sp. GilTou73]